MTSVARRVTSMIAAFALVQATVAPGLVACDRSHDDVAVAVPAMTMTDQSNPAHAGHSDCPESDVPPSQAPHNEDCQASCVSMLGCSALSFVGALPLFDMPDESSIIPTQAPLSHPNRSLTPESPPPKA